MCYLFSMADIENAEPSNISSIKIETAQNKERDEICQTSSKKRICYAGDKKFRNVENMTFVKLLNILKKSCEKKDKIINRLRIQHYRQKKKIESLKALLSEQLSEKSLISPISSDI